MSFTTIDSTHPIKLNSNKGEITVSVQKYLDSPPKLTIQYTRKRKKKGKRTKQSTRTLRVPLTWEILFGLMGSLDELSMKRALDVHLND